MEYKHMTFCLFVDYLKTVSTERSGSLYSIKGSFNLLVWPSPEEPRQIWVLSAIVQKQTGFSDV